MERTRFPFRHVTQKREPARNAPGPMRFLMLCLTTLLLAAALSAAEPPLEPIRISDDGASFVFSGSGERFVPWGFNYDHDASGRLIEDYWANEWPAVVGDFREMKELGANVVRIHLQFGKFMLAPDRPNPESLMRLERLVRLAEEVGLYLDLTGLGCYHKRDVPPWYDAMTEKERWKAQAAFWEAVSARCANSPAVFFYDLMNEPVAPAGKRPSADWLGPPLGDKHFVQRISLDAAGRERHEVARLWIETLVAAIRKHDRRHLISVGMVPWSLDRPGLTSGFVPQKVAGKLDFIAMHIYPESGMLDAALETVAGFDVGKPILIEETFPLRCTAEELGTFIDRSTVHADGWIGFYWGKTPDEYRGGKTIADAIVLKWLELFRSGPPRPRQH